MSDKLPSEVLAEQEAARQYSGELMSMFNTMDNGGNLERGARYRLRAIADFLSSLATKEAE